MRVDAEEIIPKELSAHLLIQESMKMCASFSAVAGFSIIFEVKKSLA